MAFESLISKRYAKALLLIAEEHSSIEDFKRDLSVLEDVLNSSEELSRLIKNPVIDKKIQHGIFERIVEQEKFHPLSESFLLLLVDKGRIRFIESIIREFNLLYNDKLSLLEAELYSASKLSKEELSEIRSLLCEKMNASVLLKHQVDEELLGGMLIKIGDTVFDSSLRSHLERIKNRVLST